MVLPTPYGKLKVSDALLCPSIKGTIISTGKFGKADGKVEYDGSTYIFVQDGVRFPTREVNNCCFLPLLASRDAIILSVNDNHSLIHKRIGHLSGRLLERTLKLSGLSGKVSIPLPLDKENCETCALVKSKHRVPELLTRDLVHQPGDVVAADIVGPYALSVDGYR